MTWDVSCRSPERLAGQPPFTHSFSLTLSPPPLTLSPQHPSELGDEIDSRAVSSRLVLLALHFPRLRLVWSRRWVGPHTQVGGDGESSTLTRAATVHACMRHTPFILARPIGMPTHIHTCHRTRHPPHSRACSLHATADIFAALKSNMDEPDPLVAQAVGLPVGVSG